MPAIAAPPRRRLLALALAAALGARELRAESLPDPCGDPRALLGALGQTAARGPLSLRGVLDSADWTAGAATLLLGLALVWLAGVSVRKSFALRELNRQADRFLHAFRGARSLDDLSREDNASAVGPLARMFAAGMDEYHATSDRGLPIRGELRDRIQERIAPAVGRIQSREARDLANSMSLLVGVALAAPLLGLLGTVCGVMTSLMRAAQAAAELEFGLLAPHLAAALLATAAGLATAILAVLLHARFERLIRRFQGRLDDFAREFAVALAREIDDRWPL